jgi:hypothetical protein
VLILEIAAGVSLGILAIPVLWVLAVTIYYRHKERRWWWAYRKHENMVHNQFACEVADEIAARIRTVQV